MAFDFTADLDVLFNTEEFGISATLTANGVTSTPVVLFDEAFTPSSPIGGTIADTTPSCLIQAAEYATYTRGDTIVISGTTYKIHRREPEEDRNVARLYLGVD